MDIRFTLTNNRTKSSLFLEGENEPLGWDEIEIQLERHETFHGVFPFVTSKLKFPRAGRDFIKTAYLQDGIDADLGCFIEYENISIGVFSVDMSDVSFIGDTLDGFSYAEANLKPSGCTDLFLNRTNVKMDMYDDPQYTSLTLDKTEKLRRYVFAPYQVEFPEKTILALSAYDLVPSPLPNEQTSMKLFGVFGGINCDLTICDRYCKMGLIVGTCENSDNAGTPFPFKGNDADQDPILGCNEFQYYIITPPFTKVIIDDLDVLVNTDFPSTTYQFQRNCGNELEELPPPTAPGQMENPFYEDVSTPIRWNCNCCGPNCSDVIFNIDCEIDCGFALTINEGVLLATRIYTDLVILGYKDDGTFVYKKVIATLPGTYLDNAGASYHLGDDIPFTVPENLGTLTFNGIVSIPACDMVEDVNYIVTAWFNPSFQTTTETVLGSSDIDMFYIAYYKRLQVVIYSKNCIPDMPQIGETKQPSWAVHESLTRLVEFYTNDCLRVQSDFFGRPNSFEGADDPDYQNPYIEGTNINVDPPCTPDSTMTTTEMQKYQRECAGCGAWTVITNGVNLRSFGNGFFLSFDDLFQALDCVFNIGVGYNTYDPANLRIEAKEYFYRRNIVMTLYPDPKESGFKRMSVAQMYYNTFVTGYAESLKDEVNTIDEFNTKREYSLAVRNATDSLTKQCEFIASGYAIEYQRRQRYSVDSQFDDSNFIVCVGQSVDINHLDRNGLPYHMYRVEIGVDSPQTKNPNPLPIAPFGFIDPATVYNWRISPFFNTLRWLNVLKATLYRKKNGGEIDFSKGETNYFCGGNEYEFNPACDFGATGYGSGKNDYGYGSGINHFENDTIYPVDITQKRTAQIWENEMVEFKQVVSFLDFMRLMADPHGTILVNDEAFFLKRFQFKMNGESKFTLLKAFAQNESTDLDRDCCGFELTVESTTFVGDPFYDNDDPPNLLGYNNAKVIFRLNAKVIVPPGKECYDFLEVGIYSLIDGQGDGYLNANPNPPATCTGPFSGAHPGAAGLLSAPTSQTAIDTYSATFLSFYELGTITLPFTICDLYAYFAVFGRCADGEDGSISDYPCFWTSYKIGRAIPGCPDYGT